MVGNPEVIHLDGLSPIRRSAGPDYSCEVGQGLFRIADRALRGSGRPKALTAGTVLNARSKALDEGADLRETPAAAP